MSNQQQRAASRLVGLVALTLAALQARPASAYNGREHERLPDQAYQLLNILRRGEGLQLVMKTKLSTPGQPSRLLTDRPPSVPASEQARWNRYVAEALAAADKLDLVLTDLKNPLHSSDQCDNKYPSLPAPPTDAGVPSLQLANCRAGELPFPPRRGWGGTDGSCFLRRGYMLGDADPSFGPEFFETLPSNYTGALLGNWATRPDDEVDDVHLFFKLSNSGLASAWTTATDLVVQAGVALVIAPYVCLIALLSGDNCIDEAIDTARSVKPAEAIAGALPGIGDFDGDDFFMPVTGVWHLMHMDRTGAFNVIPGMHQSHAGPSLALDSLDLLILAGTDVLGVTLNSSKSLGISRYAPFEDGPQRPATKTDWEGVAFGHVEFEPASNMAMYGWQEFQNNRGARGLGWVLHLIGDAFEPQHIVGANGWGHRVFEDMTGRLWRTAMHEGQDEHYNNLLTVMEQGYQWWKRLDDGQGGVPTNDLPIRGFIRDIGAFTRGMAGPAYVTNISLDHLPTDGDGDAALAIYNFNAPGAKALVPTLMKQGIAASLAFLVKAGGWMSPPTIPSPCACQPGSGRWAIAADGNVVSAAACTVCGQGVFAGFARSLDGQCVARCPADRPLTQNGQCVAAPCSGGGCTGTQCPAATPFLSSNGTCSANCTPGSRLTEFRTCEPNCPAGQSSSMGVCKRNGKPGPTDLCNSGERKDATGSCMCTTQQECASSAVCFDGKCCRARGTSCADDKECCSSSCDKTDGVCRGRPGDSCVADSNCITGVCTSNRKCGPGPASFPCVFDSDCVSGLCLANKVCAGLPGDRCSETVTCSNGSCVGVEEPVCCGFTGSPCLFFGHCCSGGMCVDGKCTNIPIE